MGHKPKPKKVSIHEHSHSSKNKSLANKQRLFASLKLPSIFTKLRQKKVSEQQGRELEGIRRVKSASYKPAEVKATESQLKKLIAWVSQKARAVKFPSVQVKPLPKLGLLGLIAFISVGSLAGLATWGFRTNRIIWPGRPSAAPMIPEDSFVWPIAEQGVISSCFGLREPVFEQGNENLSKTIRSKHGGIDIAVQRNTPVLASKAGVVIKAEHNSTYGDYILLQHADGFQTRYAHLKSLTNIELGAFVQKREFIGHIGLTGMTTGMHLHFEIRSPEGQTVDPTFYLSDRVGEQMMRPEDHSCWHPQIRN
jgi:murein DD-endopeptidase MepM/ murein hydrolase activator NlpD